MRANARMWGEFESRRLTCGPPGPSDARPSSPTRGEPHVTGGVWHQTNLHQTVTHGSARGADKGGMIHQHGRERAIFDVARPPTPRPTPLSGGGPFGTWACWSTLPCEYALRNYFCRASSRVRSSKLPQYIYSYFTVVTPMPPTCPAASDVLYT